MLGRILLFLGVLLLPLATAGWNASEGTPYAAEEHVVLPGDAVRTMLSAAGGVVAWLEDAHHDGQRTQGALVLLDRKTGITTADAPSVGERFVVWRDHALATDRMVNAGSRVGVLRLDTGAIEYHGEGGRVASPPRLDGDRVAWASQGSYPDPAREILRRDLTSGQLERWPIPVACWLDDAWPVGDAFVLSSYDCMGQETGGLWVWTPGTEPLRLAARPLSVAVDAGRVVFTEYRAGEGAGTNLYVFDIGDHEARRATFSPGREAFPSLSGDTVAWVDTRDSERREPAYIVYFEDLRTQNEYQVAGGRDVRAGPVLDGRDLWYVNGQGELIRARLPQADALLTAHLEARADDAGASVELTLRADDATTIAHWDTDLDGVFETEGTLRVQVNDDGPEIPRVMGQLVDDAGRLSVMSVDVRERWSLAKALHDLTHATTATSAEDVEPAEPAPAERPAPRTETVVVQPTRETPFPALASVLAAFLAATTGRRTPPRGNG